MIMTEMATKDKLIIGGLSIVGIATVIALSRTASASTNTAAPTHPYTYFIFQINGINYAQNGMTGTIDFSDADMGVILNSCMNSPSMNPGGANPGGTIFIQDGVYWVYTQIVIPDIQYITIQGTGSSSVLANSLSASDMIVDGPSNNFLSYFIIKNLRLEGGGHNTNLLHFEHFQGATVDNVIFNNFGNSGLAIGLLNNGIGSYNVNNCTFNTGSPSSVAFINIGTLYDSTFSKIWGMGGWCANPPCTFICQYCIKYTGGGNVQFQNMHISNVNKNILLLSNIQNVIFSNCIFDNANQEIVKIDSGIAGPVTDVIFIGCTFNEIVVNQTGLLLNAVQNRHIYGINVTGCSFGTTANAGYGIHEVDSGTGNIAHNVYYSPYFIGAFTNPVSLISGNQSEYHQ